MKTADDLVRDLILRRITERFEHLPYSIGHHVAHCDIIEVADVSNEEGVPDMCGTCEHVAFKARVSCGHESVEFEFGEPGRLPWILADLAELAEAREATR